MWRVPRVLVVGVFLGLASWLSFGLAPSLLAQTPPPPVSPEQLRMPGRAPQAPPAFAAQQMPSAAAAVVQPTAAQVAAAVGIQPTDVISVSWEGTDPLALGVATVPLGNYFPTEGNSFVVLSSGQADSAELPNTQGSLSYQLGGLNNSQGNDLAQLVLQLKVSNTMNCANLDFAFLSEEFPEYVGSSYNDTFTAELGTSSLVISNTQVSAPNNFAFDTAHNLISVNTVFGVSAATASTYDGETPLLRAQTPVTPGAEINLIFSVQDLGDSIYDSSAFLDKFFWSSDPLCNPGSQVDEDGDGMLGIWETNGLTVTVNGADVFVDLPAMGANPKKKDIFVELDYMVDPGVCLPVIGCQYGHSHLPSATVIDRVVQAFANAPVPNPDGTTGIVLHVDAGADRVMNPPTGALWGSQSRSNSLAHVDALGTSVGNNYDWTAFDAIKQANFSTARASVFHYLVVAHNLGGQGSTSGKSRDIRASDFIVSLGSWSGKTGTAQEQAGTIMHELGHNLGLRHSGVEDIAGTNFKPNYLSVMNYAFQTDGLIINHQEGHLDYSRFALPSLDENALDEQLGLNGGPNIAQYGTRYWCSMDNVRLSYTPMAIDWNCDGDNQDGGIAENINEGPSWRHDEVLGTLPSYNDWQNLVFTGGAIGQPGAQPVLPQQTPVEEIDQEEAATIPAVYDVALNASRDALLPPGVPTVINLQITNRGTTADTYTVSAVADVPWLDLGAIPSQISLAPGTSVEMPVTAEPPGSSVGQTGAMTIAVASQGNPLLADAAVSHFTVIAEPLASAGISAVATLVADGHSQTPVSVQVLDYYARPIAGVPVTVTTTRGTIDSPVLTDANGVATAQLTAGTQAGTAQVAAYALAIAAATTIEFVAGTPANLELTPEAAVMDADGASAIAINFRLRDAFANAVPNVPVAFSTTLGTIAPAGTTNAAGVGSVQFTSAQALGTATISATAGSATAQTSVLLRGEGVGGLVFADLNRNGQRDLGEPGVGDIEVTATLEANAAAAAEASAVPTGTAWHARTNAGGTYAFTELPFGTYTVAVQVPAGRTVFTPFSFVLQVGKSGATAPVVGMAAELALPYLKR